MVQTLLHQLDDKENGQRVFRTISTDGYTDFDHGYATTIHKSQGATVDRSYVLASRSMDRHLAYVAMTRHREDMALFISNRDRPIWAQDHRQHIHPKQTRSRDGPSMG